MYHKQTWSYINGERRERDYTIQNRTTRQYIFFLSTCGTLENFTTYWNIK